MTVYRARGRFVQGFDAVHVLYISVNERTPRIQIVLRAALAACLICGNSNRRRLADSRLR